MGQFILGTFIISLSLVWGGGAAVATNHVGWGFALTALGAGWMGIIWGTLLRQLSLCEACLGDEKEELNG
jgi:hypothetical protein